MVRQHLRSGVPASRPEKTRDGRFGYEAAGNPASRPLVFLHGIGGAARAWRGQLDAFKDRYRAIAWDMPGYGGAAPRPSARNASPAQAVPEFLHHGTPSEPLPLRHSVRRRA